MFALEGKADMQANSYLRQRVPTPIAILANCFLPDFLRVDAVVEALVGAIGRFVSGSAGIGSDSQQVFSAYR